MLSILGVAHCPPRSRSASLWASCSRGVDSAVRGAAPEMENPRHPWTGCAGVGLMVRWMVKTDCSVVRVGGAPTSYVDDSQRGDVPLAVRAIEREAQLGGTLPRAVAPNDDLGVRRRGCVVLDTVPALRNSS